MLSVFVCILYIFLLVGLFSWFSVIVPVSDIYLFCLRSMAKRKSIEWDKHTKHSLSLRCDWVICVSNF